MCNKRYHINIYLEQPYLCMLAAALKTLCIKQQRYKCLFQCLLPVNQVNALHSHYINIPGVCEIPGSNLTYTSFYTINSLMDSLGMLDI